MSEIEDFRDYLLSSGRYNFSKEQQRAVVELGYIINHYLREKAKPKGFHGTCTSTKHSIGAGYCPDCQP